MSGSAQHLVESLGCYDRLWWIPGNGRGNGFESHAWVAMLDVGDPEIADAVLMALARSQIPGYAAPLPRRQAEAEGAWFRRRAPLEEHGQRIWVAADARGRAEARLIQILPGLRDRFGPGTFR